MVISFVAGDAVNVAQRLQASAAPGEILIGEQTYRFARDAVVAELVAPLDLKGKRDGVVAYRTRRGATRRAWTRSPASTRRWWGAIVRLEGLRQAFEAAVESNSCHLLTVLGPAGVGKSRLAAEAIRHIGDRGTVLSGSCLAYGEGITFWPVLEIVRQGTGIADDDSPQQARAKIEAALAGDEAAELVSAPGG